MHGKPETQIPTTPSAQLLGILRRDQVPISFVFQMLVWFSRDLIPFHLLTWQLVIGCTDYQI